MDATNVTAAVLDVSVFAVGIFCSFVLGAFTGAGWARARIRNGIRRRIRDELGKADKHMAKADAYLAQIQGTRPGPVPGEPVVEPDHDAIARVAEFYRHRGVIVNPAAGPDEAYPDELIGDRP